MITRHHFFAAILLPLVSYMCYCEDMYLLLCEGQTKAVSCPNNTSINVISASYGYNGSNEKARDTCDDWRNRYLRNLDDTKCENDESTTDIVTDKCDGRSECTIGANNEVFGDPCRGTTKYFQLNYICTRDRSDDGDGKNRDSKDDSKIGNADENDSEKNDSKDGDSDEESDDVDDDGEEDDDDWADGTGLSPVAVVAIAAGIPVGLGLCFLFVIVALCAAFRMKRRKILGATNNRNMSINQYERGVLTMTATSDIEDSGMFYNTTYQSVSQDDPSANQTTGHDRIDNIRTNYENLNDVEVTNENAGTENEGMIYNDTYQSINDNNPKR